MNARVDMEEHGAGRAWEAEQMRRALDAVLRSAMFGKAPRMRQLLAFLVEAGHVRACMRLLDAQAGQVAWLAQFDGCGELGMALQENLAVQICAGLRRYLKAW